MLTSRMESATRSVYHNHDRQHLQSLMVLHLHSQSGLVYFEHTSTAVSLSTSTSWISPTMRRALLQQCSRDKQHSDSMKRLYGLHKRVKTSETNRHYLKVILDVARVQSSLRIYNKYNKTLVHNKYVRMQQLQEYDEQVNFLVTSSCTLQSQTANQTIYFVDFRGPTSVERCLTVETSTCCRSSCTTAHLVTEHCRSTTLMDRDITTTAVSKIDTRCLSLRNHASCHR